MKTEYFDIPLERYEFFKQNLKRDEMWEIERWQKVLCSEKPENIIELTKFLSKISITTSSLPVFAVCNMFYSGTYVDIVKYIQRQFVMIYGIETVSRSIGRQFPRDKFNDRRLDMGDVKNYLHAKAFGMDEMAEFYSNSFHTTDTKEAWYGLPRDFTIVGFVLKLIALSKGEDPVVPNHRMRRPPLGLFQPMIEHWGKGQIKDSDECKMIAADFVSILDHHWKTIVQFHNGSAKAYSEHSCTYCNDTFFDLFPLEFMAYKRVHEECGYSTVLPDHAYWKYPWVANLPERLDYIYDEEVLLPVLRVMVPYLKERNPAIMKLCSLHGVPPPLPTE